MVRRTICAFLVMALSLSRGTWYGQKTERMDPSGSQYETVFCKDETSGEVATEEDENLSVFTEAEYGEAKDKSKNKKDNNDLSGSSTGGSDSYGKSSANGYTDTYGSNGNSTGKTVDTVPVQSTEKVSDSVCNDPSEERNETEDKPSETGKQPAAETEKPVSETPKDQKPVHVHSWVTETIHHDTVSHTEHHEAVTGQKWVSVPVSVTKYYCDICGAEFSSQSEAYAHEDATYCSAMESGDMSLIHSGHYSRTETTDNGYWETVIVSESYDETVIDVPAWDEYRTVCTGCGAEG